MHPGEARTELREKVDAAKAAMFSEFVLFPSSLTSPHCPPSSVSGYPKQLSVKHYHSLIG
jgi:hypothetical protein